MNLLRGNLRAKLISAALGAVCGIALLGYFWLTNAAALIDQPAIILGHELQSIESCSESILASATVAPDTVSSIAETSGVCYDKIRYQGLLNDFQIRRAKFAIQYASERVILWMVVLLTLSGVLLAGLQLFATYQLAQTGQHSGLNNDHELTVEHGKLVLRSSVTGLFILIFSFAFFYVYISEVFTIKEMPTTAVPGITAPLTGGDKNPYRDSNNGESPTIRTMGTLQPPLTTQQPLQDTGEAAHSADGQARTETEETTLPPERDSDRQSNQE
ncbi:hypothetical protein [Lentisalinibacter salinarum]|uniref:hypothetical protein n=1 Tax=Lentisalinibacter salinarum TaxID=2992239 RepID=UPI00386A5F3C